MKIIFTTGLVLFAIITLAQTRRSSAIVNSLSSERDTARLNAKLYKLINSNQENDISAAIDYYAIKRRLVEADSLTHIAAKRFPHGHYAFSFAKDQLNQEADPGKQEILLKKLKMQFPYKAGSDELDMITGNIALNFAKNKDVSKALMYLAATKSKNIFLLPVANTLLGYDPKAASSLLIDGISHFGSAQNTEKEGTNDPHNDSARLYYYKVANSKALLKLNRPSEALANAKDAYDHLHPATANDAAVSYASALMANRQYEQALPLLRAAVTEGRSDNAIDTLLLTAYGKTSPDKNAGKYLDSLKQVLMIQKKTEVAGKMVDKICPAFIVTDEKGRQVSLADFKGKTIVLDFWATWCGPCKASFPAMQLVVNQYKNNPDVQFLFIHTMEYSATPKEDAERYLETNHYELPLYMDLKDSLTGKNPAISMFNIQGLPTKFIVDGNGHIRFKLTGFATGMDQAHATEVSAMIEMAKKGELR